MSISATLLHPIRVASILAKLGHEPVLSRPSYSITSHQYFWYYPRIFGYASGIIQERGFLGLYRGLVPSVIENVVWNAMLK